MPPSTYQLSIIHSQLNFRRPAGTSRGVYTSRRVWYVLLQDREDPRRWGIGECAPLPSLSIDDVADYEYVLAKACRQMEEEGVPPIDSLRAYPSILMGLETALMHYQAGGFGFYPTPFAQGKEGIRINGLIWMGDYDYMQSQIRQKIDAGYQCIKLKIGAIRFEEELELLRLIRRQFSAREIELRVDANGAFSPTDALEKLKRLSELDIHSIEQPIRAGQWEEMARLTEATPLPIALDEELIGNYTYEKKAELLSAIRPHYIILKPSLHGGFSGCEEWIALAEKQQIGWWATSALESNIGLNAIAQWAARWANPMPQGLGTGLLFEENIELPLTIQRDCLWFDPRNKSLPETPEDIAFPTDGNYCFQRKRQKLHALTPVGEEVKSFLQEWQNENPLLLVHTSGSTGTPKELWVRKDRMMQSARITCAFLGLKKGDVALHCLPISYIAGKMMLVRSLVAGLASKFVSPSSHPLQEDMGRIDFVALTPTQVYETLQVSEERERLKQINYVLIGGGSLPPEIERELVGFPNAIYATYGMTETLSHIALRRVSGEEATDWFTPFPSVRLSLSEEGTLVVDAPLVTGELLVTNDIAVVREDGSFRMLGRKDNVINSGGIKIQIEELETVLRAFISFNFVITSVPDPKWGEAVVLLIEGACRTEEVYILLKEMCAKEKIPKWYCPQYVFRVEKIPLTENGKRDRKNCRRLAEEIITRL
ncbi:o-succinylbenzoate synthase [Parabacteroides sp. PFB2-12]|nr:MULTISPECIES: enolase C-terminal domain-like protein [unclassified Parabacteroides]MDH6342433.1 o-succinylbenzoate synthase [Parabacteroides sp. PM6-13]MDH6390085.1 o-succinylbenzoate synthase [Parabacteroides sp. PFB2-12]